MDEKTVLMAAMKESDVYSLAVPLKTEVALRSASISQKVSVNGEMSLTRAVTTDDVRSTRFCVLFSDSFISLCR